MTFPGRCSQSILLVIAVGSAAPGIGQAQSPGAPEAAIPSFGRLFTTPDQRASLDAPLVQPPDIVSQTPSASAPADAVVDVREARLSGLMLRDDGQHMVWINGRSKLSPLTAASGVRSGKPRTDSLRVPVMDQTRTMLLKPGQVWLLEENRVEESYRVQPVGPEPQAESASEPEPEPDE